MGAEWMQCGWMQHGCSMGAVWMQRGCRVDAVWMQRGCMQCGCSVGAVWMQCGCSVGSCNVDAAWVQYGCSMGTVWVQRGYSMGAVWVQGGCRVGACNVDAVWMQCGCSMGAVCVHAMCMQCGCSMDAAWAQRAQQTALHGPGLPAWPHTTTRGSWEVRLPGSVLLLLCSLLLTGAYWCLLVCVCQQREGSAATHHENGCCEPGMAELAKNPAKICWMILGREAGRAEQSCWMEGGAANPPTPRSHHTSIHPSVCLSVHPQEAELRGDAAPHRPALPSHRATATREGHGGPTAPPHGRDPPPGVGDTYPSMAGERSGRELPRERYLRAMGNRGGRLGPQSSAWA